MAFASGSFGQLRYIDEAAFNVVPVVGNSTNLRMLTPTMKAAIASVSSQEINEHRMSQGLTRTDLNIDGGFNFELSGREYDPFLEGVLFSTFVHYGANGLGTAFDMATTANTITAAVAPTTTSALTNLAVGSWFKVVPPLAASAAVKEYFNDKWFKVLTRTGTVITLDPATPIEGVGLMASTIGYRISQSVASNGVTQRSFTFEHALTDVSTFFRYSGMRANTMELSMEVGSIITGSFGFIGATHDAGPATYMPGTPIASQALDVMNSVTDVGAIFESGVNILSGSTSFIKSVKFMINNNARGQKAVGVFGNAGVGLGELEVSGTLEIYVENPDYYLKWLRGVTTSLTLGVADIFGNGYMIEMDRVQYQDGGLNPGGRNDDVMLSLPFRAFYNAATGRGLRITRAVAA